MIEESGLGHLKRVVAASPLESGRGGPPIGKISARSPRGRKLIEAVQRKSTATAGRIELLDLQRIPNKYGSFYQSTTDPIDDLAKETMTRAQLEERLRNLFDRRTKYRIALQRLIQPSAPTAGVPGGRAEGG